MNDVAAMPSYRVERGDIERDRDAVLRIWRGNLGRDEHMRAKFDWFYRHCPYGAPLLALLRHEPDGGFVGVAAAGPRRMAYGARTMTAGVLVDLAVAAEHRSLGPALMLQRELAAAGAQHFDLLYGFPNAKAVPLIRRLGLYEPVGDMVRYARVLRYRHYVGRRLPRAVAPLAGLAIDATRRIAETWRAWTLDGIRVDWSGFDDVRIDALWERAPRDGACVAVRDRRFLRWRFGHAAGTRLLRVSDRDGDTLQAWFACQTKDKVLHVGDAWSDAGSAGIGRGHIEALLHAAYGTGHAAISFEFSGPERGLSAWKDAGFVERGRRPVYGRWCAADAAPDLSRTLHLTSADEDE
ncbi:hypothetical protein [Dokdonella sp.]|uniref:hypothetical protein n=1 Tax=Dokdonella sp. TaxID=2291710 RepID=UPI002624FB17|nr:hypothetical protein [Dokdonella sp.]